MNKNMAPKLLSMPCFEAFGVRFCPDFFSFMFLPCMRGKGVHSRISEYFGGCLRSGESKLFAQAIHESNSDHPHPPYLQKYAPKICHTMGVCMVRCFFAPPSMRNCQSQFSAISKVFPQILVDFQSILMDFLSFSRRQFQSVSVTVLIMF